MAKGLVPQVDWTGGHEDARIRWRQIVGRDAASYQDFHGLQEVEGIAEPIFKRSSYDVTFRGK